MGLNGIIFISQALDYTGSSPYVRDNLIAHATYLPTMAAVALYHSKINPRPDDMESFLEQARAFATDELLPALFKAPARETGAMEQRRSDTARTILPVLVAVLFTPRFVGCVL